MAGECTTPIKRADAAMRRFLDENRRTCLCWGRRYLGWGVFVTRSR